MNNSIFNYFMLSKYILKSLFYYPKLINLTFTIILYYKQKNKYFLFINIILLLLFTSPCLKTRFFFKTSPINILQLNLRSQNALINFINNFIYLYFPLIDSFSTELKYYLKKTIVKFCFLKFPLLFELNILFLSFEYLYIFLNNYKFQLEFKFKQQKNYFINYNLLQFLKLPILLE